LVNRRGKLITKFQRELLRYQAELYSKALENPCAPMGSFAGFIEDMKWLWTTQEEGNITRGRLIVAIGDSIVFVTNFSPLRTVCSSIYTDLRLEEGQT
jgi:hypothetical protein